MLISKISSEESDEMKFVTRENLFRASTFVKKFLNIIVLITIQFRLDKANEQNLRLEAAVIGEKKMKYEC